MRKKERFTSMKWEKRLHFYEEASLLRRGRGKLYFYEEGEEAWSMPMELEAL